MTITYIVFVMCQVTGQSSGTVMDLVTLVMLLTRLALISSVSMQLLSRLLTGTTQ
jgi:hypothetical protein